MEIKEYERIVEFSFNEKEQRYVIRFLDGTSCILHINDLPKKLQTKKPKWKDSILSENQTTIIVQAGNDARQIPAHIIHSRGTIIE